MKASEMAALIDHTVLKPEATQDQVEKLCAEAREYTFATVCVAPTWTALAASLLKGTPVGVATVVGFPHGNTLSQVKAIETTMVVEAGATEVDMVLNVGALKDGNEDLVRADIKAVVEAAEAAGGAGVKVIFETALLTDAQKATACRLSEEAGADFVKTSTGFASGGATTADIALMRGAVGDRLGVKASGGIRDLATALAMVEAGASRLGCSASVAIVEELRAQEKD